MSAPAPMATPARGATSEQRPEVAALLESVRALAAVLESGAVGGIDQSPTPEGGEPDGAALIDLISSLEDLTAAAAAVQARAAMELDKTRRTQEARQEIPARRRGRGVAAEVALAARTSLARGSTLLGFGKALCLEMPHTLAALAAGRLSPWRAMLLVKESACLPAPDRVRMDRELCEDPERLAGLGDRQVGGAARRWCATQNPAAVVERQRRAESERQVTLRPAPDTMAYLTALLPVAEGVAAYKALTEHADAARAAGPADDGQPRSRGQLMADALVTRLTGVPEGERPPVLVNLVMTDRALFSGGTDAAELPGYGPVPAAWARDLVRDSAQAWVRRLYTSPGTGASVAMDSRKRTAPAGLAAFIELRDHATCRVAWCDAPGRHIDHADPAANSGSTSGVNQQVTCEAHNYAKQAPGWSASGPPSPVSSTVADQEPHRIHTTTPTGHRYASAARPPPWQGVPRSAAGPRPFRLRTRPRGSPGERTLAETLARAA